MTPRLAKFRLSTRNQHEPQSAPFSHEPPRLQPRPSLPADQSIWPAFPRVSKTYDKAPPQRPRRPLHTAVQMTASHPDQGLARNLPAASTSTLSLDTQYFDAGDLSNHDAFFPLPPSSRFTQARFPFKPEDVQVDGHAQTLEWLPITSRGRHPSKGICAHTTTRVGNALYLIAGCDTKGCLNSVRRLDMMTLQWTKVKPKYRDAKEQKPPKSRAHTATRVHDSIVVYGGGNGPQYYGAVWIFNTKTEEWYKPIVTGPPPSPRRAHDAVLDARNNRICYFGGGNGQEALNDLVLLDVSDPQLLHLTWMSIPLSSEVDRPPARGYHTFTQVDDAHAVLFGGSDGYVSYGDCHILKLDTLTWRHLKVDQKHYRMSHTAVVIGCKLFVLGGHDSTQYVDMSQVLEVDLRDGKSTIRDIVGSLPQARGYFTCNMHHDMVVCIGGFDGSKLFEDTWALQLSVHDWMSRFEALPLGANAQ